MKSFRIAALTIALGLGCAGAAQAQTVGYNVRTGDVWVDNRLGEINDYGYRYRDPFVDEVSRNYGAPRPYVTTLLEQRRWAPADVYYACSMAHALRVPCSDLVQEYDRDPGQGWGAIAQRRGIKPGSAAFHAMKRGTVATYDRWGYPITIDRDERVDWSKHGPGHDHAGKPAHHGRGDDHAGMRGPGAREHGKPATKAKQPKPKGQGKGKDKGGKGKG